MVERRQEVIDGRRVLRQADEDVAASGLHVHRLEAVLVHVEVGAHFGAGEQQATVEFVGPLVVVANQLGDLALVAGAQARATVAADVVKRMHHAFGSTNDDDRVLADLQGQVVALGRDLAGHAGDQPLFLKDFLHVDIKQALVGVKRLRQRERALALLQHLCGGLACGFQRIAQAQCSSDVHRLILKAILCGRRKWLIRVATQGVMVVSWYGASVGPALARTLSMGDMVQSVPDAQAPVVGGWSR
ncbi:hypothetical protein D3C78_1086230 [compost metagenome]